MVLLIVVVGRMAVGGWVGGVGAVVGVKEGGVRWVT